MTPPQRPDVPRSLVDLYLLRTFVAVVQEGHLTRAAERIHVSQPTASAHVKSLEEAFGVELFTRRNGGFEVTHAGEALYHKAIALLDHALEFRSMATSLGNEIGGNLTIGSNADPLISRIGEIVAALHTRHSMLSLKVELRATASILQGLRNGELDAGFFLGAATGGSLEALTLKSLTYRVVGPVAWSAMLADGALKTLAGLPWIVTPPGSSHHDMMCALFQGSGLAPRSVAEVNNYLLVRSLVSNGVGISLMREDHALAAQREGEVCVSPTPVPGTNLMFAMPKARRREPALAALAASVRQVWRPPGSGGT